MNQLVRRIDANPLQQLQRAARNRTRGGLFPSARGRQAVPQTGQYNHQVDESFNPHAVLVPRLRTLHQLWEEYINGIGNNKPAKFFTRAERGRKETKFIYSRRRIFWKLVEKHVNRNRAANDVIDMIYTLLGPNQSPSAIIMSIRHHTKHNTLPFQLR